MNCIECNKKINNKNVLKKHLLFWHAQDKTSLDIEKLFIKSVTKFSDKEIDIVKKEYLDGYTVNELRQKYNFEFSNLIILLGIKRTASESKKTEKYKQKYTGTCIERYGVDNPSKVEKIKEKKKRTFIKHYKYENNFCNKNIKQKAFKNIDYVKVWKSNKKTLKSKYGVENFSQIPFVRKKISEAQKKKCSAYSYEKRMQLTEAARNAVKYTSSLEKRIAYILDILNVEYTKNVFLYCYNVDFLFNHKIILEIQGDFWHGNPTFYKINDILLGDLKVKDVWEKDKRKKEVLENNGYTVLYLWENEINKMTDDALIVYLIEHSII